MFADYGPQALPTFFLELCKKDFEQIEKVYFRYDTIFSTDSVWTFGMVNKKLNFSKLSLQCLSLGSFLTVYAYM